MIRSFPPAELLNGKTMNRKHFKLYYRTMRVLARLAAIRQHEYAPFHFDTPDLRFYASVRVIDPTWDERRSNPLTRDPVPPTKMQDRIFQHRAWRTAYETAGGMAALEHLPRLHHTVRRVILQEWQKAPAFPLP